MRFGRWYPEPGSHQCNPHDLTHDERGATCTVCDRRWSVPYLCPPYVPAKQAESMRGWWE